ncbi:S9 family peptidase [Maribellus maritimus]|uniref:S9 family peptidase n=1 Tax=Maribellus maritimus TaxID=2870838 RepID=UPI001EEBAD5C|nr:DPP IV N-terminal domain-containing protein [Maribellus maritimus]MCG6189413.1 S9 family peptidase [Maribellus maritimus]
MRKIFLLFLFLAQLVVAQQKQMTLGDAILGRYNGLSPESFENLSWRSEIEFTYLESDTLWLESAKKGEKIPFIVLEELNAIVHDSTGIRFKNFPQYSWVNDSEMLIQNRNKFLLIDSGNKKLVYKYELPLSAENAEFNIAGKFVVYTVKDDLFISFADGGKVQVTFDGGQGIVNGKSVHRSEFGISGGIFNSPQGNFVAFYRKDESRVHDYPLVDFMERQAEYTPVKYPMAGLTSEQVKLGIYKISSGKTVFMKTGEPLDHYLTNIAWSPDEKNIYIAELNRGQNHMQLNCYDVSSGEKVKTLFEETDERYVEPLYPIQFSQTNKNEFYYLSRKDGWFHIYKYNTQGQLLKQITKGEWEVTNVLGFDSKEKFVFVEATKESPLENHIYRVNIKTGEMEKLSNRQGVHSGVVSPGGKFIIDNWSAPKIPHNTDLISADGSKRKNLLSSKDPLEDFQLGENKLVSILSADGKTELAGRLILPVDFDPSKKYPVIVYVYGGPHSQLVNKSWNNQARWWQYYMASQGYIAFTMDNRGTLNRGRDFETVVHRQLGILETEDQMKGIEYLKSLPYVDSDRIGVHGWSYGGFMTLNLMLRHPEVFKVGVAGGPVVDWSMYEVMYGERYMDTPQENPEGFKETNMLNHVPGLQGKLMLVHGVQDETVVMQHSMKFLRECVKQEKQLDFFVYPTHPHNVRGKDRVHLMQKVSDYFIDNL